MLHLSSTVLRMETVTMMMKAPCFICRVQRPNPTGQRTGKCVIRALDDERLKSRRWECQNPCKWWKLDADLRYFIYVNAYNDILVSNIGVSPNTNPMAREKAFTGSDGGEVSGSWKQSQIDLTGLASAEGYNRIAL